MASLTRHDGLTTIQVVGLDGKRRSIRLGRVSDRDGQRIHAHIEELATARRYSRPLMPETEAWLGKVGTELRVRLETAGLVAAPKPKTATVTLGSFLDSFIAARSTIKASTLITYQNVRRNLLRHFGADGPLDSITPGEGVEFALFLAAKTPKGEGLADNTVRRRVGIARQIFRHALKRKLIGENPFADIPVAVRSNPARKRYVTRAEIETVISSAPDDEWRLCIALARFGGLRIPSEAVGLKWGDVDWERGRITIRAPKTDHHGTGIRQIPLFPEIRPLLLTLFDDAEEGSEYVLGERFRSVERNLRTGLGRIIRKAGLKPWPKVWVNQRASCATDLAQKYPAHVCASWLGHTEAIAESFYLQTLDEHFEAASEAVQKAVQYGAETGGKDENATNGNSDFSREFSAIPAGDSPTYGRHRTRTRFKNTGKNSRPIPARCGMRCNPSRKSHPFGRIYRYA